MRDAIINKSRNELITALQRIPHSKEVPLKEYLEMLMVHFKNFQQEVEWNIYCKNSYSFSIDYVSSLIEEFKCLYMTFDGSFDVILFPEILSEQQYIRLIKIKNYVDSHRFTYMRTISMLQKRESIINTKITHKIPIVELQIDTEKLKFHNKYRLKEKKIMDVIEIGYYLFVDGNIITEHGKPIDLIPFIKDLGAFVGEEINNIHQRLDELKNRANQHKFLDSLIKINTSN